MAQMIPENAESFATGGEERVYKFLETVAKPDSQYLSWYTPDIEDREPDFILFSNATGLIVLEVKDWNFSQIKEATPHGFTVLKGANLERNPNPLRQARGYMHALINRFKKDGTFVRKLPQDNRRHRIPIECGVVFPNIRKREYENSAVNDVIPAEKVFFWDDLQSTSEICSDSSGECFLKTLLDKYPPRFKCAFLTQYDLDRLRYLLYPEFNRLDDVRRSDSDDYFRKATRG